MCWIFPEKWALETALRVLSRKGVVLVVGGGWWGGGGLWPCVIFQEGAAHSITPPPPPPPPPTSSSTDYCHAFYKPPPTQMIKRPWSWLDPIMLTLDRRCKRRQRSFVGSWNARPVAGGNDSLTRSPCHRPFCEDVEQQELGNRIIWTVTHYYPREGVGWFTFSVPGWQCVDWQRGTTRYKSGLQRYTPGILQVHAREVTFKIWESVANKHQL